MITNISDKKYLSDPIFQTLRDRIVSGQYPPRTLLAEKDLTQEFKVSRTPYREAVRKLEEIGLVTVIPRFGSFVTDININEIKQAYEVRVRLEKLAAELAAERITKEELGEFEKLIHRIKKWKFEQGLLAVSELDACFHDQVYQASHNPKLAEIIRGLRLICARIWTTSWREKYNAGVLISRMVE
ncbi:MAG: GntR family transcriptional regulator, partial [Pseudomonadota bacterium]